MKSETPMTLKARRDGLISLIKDCRDIKANKSLILNYQKQLKEVEKEILDLKQRRK